MRVCARMFSPFCSVAVSCPIRRTAWRLKSENFDYRAAAIYGALGNPNGDWFSRCDERIRGELDLLRPTPPSDLPNDITARIRVSWFPAHVTVIWQDGGAYQKLPMRPPEGPPSCWYEAEYDHGVFTDEIHRAYPKSFQSQFSPPPPSSRKSDTSEESESASGDTKTPLRAEKSENAPGDAQAPLPPARISNPPAPSPLEAELPPQSSGSAHTGFRGVLFRQVCRIVSSLRHVPGLVFTGLGWRME